MMSKKRDYRGHGYSLCRATDLQPHLLLQQTIGRTDAWRQGRLGKLRGGGSGHWEWQVTPARLFLALACVVLFNYAAFENEKNKKQKNNTLNFQ